MSDIDTTQSKMYNRVINFQSIVRLFAKDISPFAFFFVDTFENKGYNEGIYYKLLVYIVCH